MKKRSAFRALLKKGNGGNGEKRERERGHLHYGLFYYLRSDACLVKTLGIAEAAGSIRVIAEIPLELILHY